jgi:hypothetical protein
MFECRGRKDDEGKTSGSILHDLVYAHECALLISFCNIPRFYQILREIFAFVLYVLIEISQEFKTFEFI